MDRKTKMAVEALHKSGQSVAAIVAKTGANHKQVEKHIARMQSVQKPALSPEG